MRPKPGADAVYTALTNQKCGTRVTVRAVFERTAIVEYATGVLEEVQLSRLSEVPSSWNEPQPSIVVSLDRLKAELGNPVEFDRLAKKRGLK